MLGSRPLPLAVTASAGTSGRPGRCRGSARSARCCSPRRTWRTRRARPHRCRGTASGVVSHGSLTLTTLVGCTTLPRASRGPITDSTAPTPSPVQNGRAPSTPSSSPTAALREQTRVSRLGLAPLSSSGSDGSRGVDDALRAEVARAGGQRVVAVTGRRRAALEVLRQRVAVGVGERLPDQAAAHRLSVGLDDRAVGVVVQAGDLGHQPDEDRVGDAEDHGEHQQRPQRGPVLTNKIGEVHGHIPGKSWITRSISLMPMNGAMMPPSP